MYRGFGHVASRGGCGLGFRGNSPPYPYVGVGRGGLPRCGYYSRTPYYEAPSLPPRQEVELLKKHAEILRKDLEGVEKRIQEIESSEKKT